ncbi:hypothetical protein CIG75_03140 [Tumebacillus algifaecis]|uniref:YqbQ/XkdQ domain-containing protein n=1 Tax=Tumebacillus algifaecis TaxID=1214604 RepID=A0A223CY40_9BACL|nr:hypothetical protein [Tumebacillus algifaecis]ASS74077.1 hypothetical protein CIG75_03140 [Tumebacillus algifaecis]
MPIIKLEERKLFGYTLLAYNEKGVKVELNPLVQSFTWSGDLDQSAMQLEVTLSPHDEMKTLVKPGDRLVLYVFQTDTGNTIQLFSGMVIDQQLQGGFAGSTRLVAHDLMYFLLKNSDDFVFRNMKASDIIKSLCGQFGVVCGVIDDSVHRIPSLVCRNHTLYDTIVKALQITRDATGDKFFLRADASGIILRKKPKDPSMWLFQGGDTLLSANFSESIANLRNHVKVVGHAANEETSPMLAEVKDDASIKRFGRLQEVHTAEETGKDKASALSVAQTVLKKLNKPERTARIQAVAVHGLYPGDPVQVYERFTGLSGVYYVKNIRTTVSSGSATVDLDLVFDEA